jgi:nitroreductase
MDFVSLARARYSCRAYRSDRIPDEQLGRVLEAMRLAPSACNRQPFRAYILQTDEYRAALRRCYHRDWLVSAPMVIIMVALMDRAWCHRDGTNLGIVDATIAFDHLILAAAAEGLGTCWIAAFDVAEVRTLLKLPDSAKPVAMTPLGFAADVAPAKERVSLEALVKFGAF